MGLGFTLLEELIDLRRRGALSGLIRVVEIGAQQLSNNFLEADALLAETYALFGRAENSTTLGTPIPSGLAADGTVELANDAPSARVFWESIGCSYAALDFDGHRDSISIDLNRDTVPTHLKGNFHLAINSGTTEHVANQDNAFRVIHDLVCVGGVMFHDVPAQGMMTHGLFNYNPKFFWHLCRENNYEVLSWKVSKFGSARIPEDVLRSNWELGGDQLLSIESIPNFTIRTALRKSHDTPFVTPMDLPT